MLDSTLSRIADGTLLPPDYYVSLDCDSALDARDRDGRFDSAWSRVYERVEGLWATAHIQDHQRAKVEEVQREAFQVVSRATGQHEIASYVSDDLGLVIRAKLVGLRDPLLDDLWQAYDRGEFPTP